MREVLLESVIDTVKMVPFLFVSFLFIEYIQHNQQSKLQGLLLSHNKAGFLSGALVGLLPQCGFSAMAAGLYTGGLIPAGTLVAVFIATSDEAIPLFLAGQGHADKLPLLLGIKFVGATLAGFFTDLLIKERTQSKLAADPQQRDCCSHRHGIVGGALVHTGQIALFVLACSLGISVAIHFVGYEAFHSFFSGLGVFGPLLCGLVGFVPNCAISVILTQLYFSGVIGFGSLVCGLCTGAGVGVLVLLNKSEHKGQALKLLGLVYAFSVVIGAVSGALFS